MILISTVALIPLSVLRNTENGDIFRSAIISDSCEECGENGYRDIREGRSRNDNESECGRVPENLDQIADSINFAEKAVVLIEVSEDVDT